jgi:hypothetical protein
MPKWTSWIACAALALCGCEALEKLQSGRVLLASFMKAPSAGSPLNPSIQMGGATAVQVFLGDLEDDGNPNSPPGKDPTGLGGAAVTINWTDPNDQTAKTVTLAEVTGKVGHYAADDQTSPDLEYHVATTYTVNAVLAGETYSATVVAPGAAQLNEFEAPFQQIHSPQAHASFPDPFTITRKAFEDPEKDRAFYQVHLWPDPPVATPVLPAPSCTNGPALTNPGAVMSYLHSAETAASFNLAKATCFPTQGRYMVSLTTTRTGTTSSNVGVASGIIAGRAYVGQVQPTQ